jgi:hypothetical protein
LEGSKDHDFIRRFPVAKTITLLEGSQ